MKNRTLISIAIAILTLSANAQFRALKSQSGRAEKPHDMFGWQVYQTRNFVFISAPHEDGTHANEGSVCVYTTTDNALKFEQRIQLPQATPFCLFGKLICADGNRLVVTTVAPVSTSLGKGYVHVYTHTDSGWIHTQTISETICKQVPTALALYRQNLVIGSAVSSLEFPHGYVQVLSITDEEILSNQLIEISGLEAQQAIGHAVAIQNEYIAFSSTYAWANGKATGKVWVYGMANGMWEPRFDLVPDGGGAYDYFGSSVSISYPYLIVGAPKHAVGNGKQTGAAFLYRFLQHALIPEAKLIPQGNVGSYDYFGCSVSLDGDRVAVGAHGDDFGGTNTGAVYVYKRNASGWFLEQKLTGNTENPQSSFGASVHMYNNRLIVSAHLEENDTNTNHGASYFFHNITHPVGVDEPYIASAMALSVYPNPAQQSINIDIPNTETLISITILDIQGKMVYNHTDPTPKQHKLDISQWKSGAYFVVVQTATQQINTQFIKH